MLRKCVRYIAHVAVSGTVPLATRDASRDTLAIVHVAKIIQENK